MDRKRAVDAVAAIAVFKGRQVRRILHEGEWWFSVVDVAGALTDSPDPGAYWRKLKQRLTEEGSEVVTFCHGLKLPAADGKNYETDCADTEGIFRIVQSIPSPKAEPFKRWLAKVGFERVKEIENLRDHMDDFELIFTMLGERATAEIHRQEDSRGVPKLKSDAHAGGAIAGNARKALEKRLKRPIVSGHNYLSEAERRKRLKPS